jgi:hypothetical protein
MTDRLTAPAPVAVAERMTAGAQAWQDALAAHRAEHHR